VKEAKPALYFALPFGAEHLTEDVGSESSSYTSEMDEDDPSPPVQSGLPPVRIALWPPS
jgi:hypothetical protein